SSNPLNPIDTADVKAALDLTGRGWGYARSEVRGLLGAFFKPFIKFTFLATLLLLLFIAPRLFIGPAGGKAGPEQQWAVQLAVAAGLALACALPVGLLAGVLSVLGRLLGGWAAVSLLLIPGAVAGSVWLASDCLLSTEGQAVTEAVRQAASRHGVQAMK